MDKVNFQSSLFVGSYELKSLVTGIENYSQAILQSLVANYGIIQTSVSFLDLKIANGTAANTVSIGAGTIFDSNLKFIDIPATSDFYTIPNDSNWYYIHVASQITNLEIGTVSVSTSGQLTGIGTSFTNYRTGAYGTRIKLTSSNNTSEYEILNITNDNLCQLSGSNFVSESGLTFKIYGNFIQGLTIADKTLYTYDSYAFSYESANNETVGTSFCLARVKYDGATRTIEDLRTQKLTLNINASDILKISNNLSDLNSVSTARTNLNVYSKSESLAVANNLSDLNNVTTARTNLDVYKKADVLTVTNNLSDLESVGTARTNLNVYSKSEVLTVANNLSDLNNTATARTNLDVYRKSETYSDTEIDNFLNGKLTATIDSWHEVGNDGGSTTYNSVWVGDNSSNNKKLSYRKDRDNNLCFAGSASTMGVYFTVFTLPIAYRPLHTIKVPIVNSTGILGYLIIATDGTVVSDVADFTVFCSVSLD